MGAAGRDFHNFLTFYKNNPSYEVVAFTATQIPGIEKRSFPAELAGSERYPNGIPIYPEESLPQLIRDLKTEEVVLAYSDISHLDVMHKASIVLSSGASFVLLGPKDTMLVSKKPVIAVCAVRTGCGKSPTVRKYLPHSERYGLHAGHHSSPHAVRGPRRGGCPEVRFLC